jgi:hypothetical protein
MLEVLRKMNDLEQVRVEFENYASYDDIATNQIIQIVIRNYLKNKRCEYTRNFIHVGW